MPARFCDDRPCTMMQRAIKSFLMANPKTLHFEVDVRLPHIGRDFPRVTLVYCPFCGTRIDPKWVEERIPRSKRRE